jgi:hypothetical protein
VNRRYRHVFWVDAGVGPEQFEGGGEVENLDIGVIVLFVCKID